MEKYEQKQKDIAKGLVKPDEHDDFEDLMKEAIKAMVKLILLNFRMYCIFQFYVM